MNLTHENKLLLLSAQTSPSEADLFQIKRLLMLPLDWEWVLNTALRLRIAPFLYTSLKGMEKEKLTPQKILKSLKIAYDRAVAKNMLLYAELRRILDRFKENGVDVVVLKGAALAETVYANTSLRTFGDLDLLVTKDNLQSVDRAMCGLDYKSICVENKSQQWFRTNHFHLAPYVNSRKSTAVDVHWHVTNMNNRIDIEEWWRRAKNVKIVGRDVLILSPEHTLIHLALHLLHHNFVRSRFRDLCDISETLKHYKNRIDWMKLREEVNGYEIKKLVYSIFYLVKQINSSQCGLPEWLNPRDVPIDSKLVSLMENQLLTGGENSSSVLGPLARLLAVDKPYDKIRIIFNTVIPPRETMSWRYSVSQSSSALYLYYFLRPLNLLLKYRKSIYESIRARI